MKNPLWFPFYPERFLLGTWEWPLEAVGLYIQGIALIWSNGSLPEDPAELAKALKCNRLKLNKYLPLLLEKFKPLEECNPPSNPPSNPGGNPSSRTGRLSHPLIEELRAKAAAKRKQTKAAADQRWKAEAEEKRAAFHASAPEKERKRAVISPSENNRSQAKPKEPPTEEALQAARMHHGTLSSCGVELEGSAPAWVQKAAAEYQRAFKNGWATPESVAEVWKFVAGPGRDFWPPQLLSAKQLFAMKEGRRKFQTVLAQARTRGKGSVGSRDKGMITAQFENDWKE